MPKFRPSQIAGSVDDGYALVSYGGITSWGIPVGQVGPAGPAGADGAAGEAFLYQFDDGYLDGSGLLTVPHNLSNKFVISEVYDDAYEKVIPTGVLLFDIDNIVIDLDAFRPLTGVWSVVIYTGVGAVGATGAAGAPAGSYGLYSARPAAGTAGRIYIPSDAPFSFFDDGIIWRPYIESACVAVEPPKAATFTNVRAIPGSSIADMAGSVGSASGGLLLVAPDGNLSDINNSIFDRPKVGNIVVTAKFITQIEDATGSVCDGYVGLYFRCNTGADAYKTVSCVTSFGSNGNQVYLQYWLDDTENISSSTIIGSYHFREDFWWRAEDDGANFVFYWSPNGRTWRQITTIARDDFITTAVIDSMGIFISPWLGTVATQVISYSEV